MVFPWVVPDGTINSRATDDAGIIWGTILLISTCYKSRVLFILLAHVHHVHTTNNGRAERQKRTPHLQTHVGPGHRWRVVSLSNRKQHPQPPCHFHDKVIGHVPGALSRILYYFLNRSGEVSYVITARWKYGVGLRCGRARILFEGSVCNITSKFCKDRMA